MMKDIKIEDIHARKILDSRGNPTIEVDVLATNTSQKKEIGRAAAPSGASRGVHEVVAFPNDSPETSIKELEEIIPNLKGSSISDQTDFDKKLRELDGTPNLSKIGGNAIVALSMAAAKAVSEVENVPLFKRLSKNDNYELPYPLGNVLGGGEHAGTTAPDIQEFLSLPIGARSFEQAAFANAKVHKRVRKFANEEDKAFTGGKSDEGAWAPNISDDKALEIVAKACEEISNELGFEIRAGLDVAASSLFDSEKGKYEYKREGKFRDTGEQIEFILDCIESYNLAYVEDPIEEEDFESFAEIKDKAGESCLICGDDIFVTNVERINRGIELDAANAVLIKPNQIGTLTATKKAVGLTKENGYVPVISHRSGETTDTTISHLAVGYGCPIIKTGAVGGERIAKLNELIRIEEKLGEKAKMGDIY